MYGMIFERRVRPNGDDECLKYDIESASEAKELFETRIAKLEKSGYHIQRKGGMVDFTAYHERGFQVHFNLEIQRPIGKAKLNDGIYTVVMPDGQRKTIRVRTKVGGTFGGRTILAYLSGSDNEKDYTGFAFLSEDGTRVFMWRRFENSGLLPFANVLLQNPEEAGMAYALESGRCYRCGRKLTVPASIHRGLGPDCAAALGGTIS